MFGYLLATRIILMLQQLFGLCRATDTHTAFAEAQIQHLVYTPSFFQQVSLPTTPISAAPYST